MAKEISDKMRKLYERTVEVSNKAALDESLPLGLRAYYAGIALFYDNKLQALTR